MEVETWDLLQVADERLLTFLTTLPEQTGPPSIVAYLPAGQAARVGGLLTNLDRSFRSATGARRRIDHEGFVLDDVLVSSFLTRLRPQGSTAEVLGQAAIIATLNSAVFASAAAVIVAREPGATVEQPLQQPEQKKAVLRVDVQPIRERLGAPPGPPQSDAVVEVRVPHGDVTYVIQIFGVPTTPASLPESARGRPSDR